MILDCVRSVFGAAISGKQRDIINCYVECYVCVVIVVRYIQLSYDDMNV